MEGFGQKEQERESFSSRKKIFVVLVCSAIYSLLCGKQQLIERSFFLIPLRTVRGRTGALKKRVRKKSFVLSAKLKFGSKKWPKIFRKKHDAGLLTAFKKVRFQTVQLKSARFMRCSSHFCWSRGSRFTCLTNFLHSGTIFNGAEQDGRSKCETQSFGSDHFIRSKNSNEKEELFCKHFLKGSQRTEKRKCTKTKIAANTLSR